MGRGYRNLKAVCHPYYMLNVIMCTLFPLSKIISPLCNILYDNCEISLQEYEMLIFLGSFIALRNKRQLSLPDYVGHFCMFGKLVNSILFWRHNSCYAILYILLWLLLHIILRRPVYNGPDRVLYFRDTTFTEEVLSGDTRISWLIAFYAAWSPACIDLAPVFAELSQEYGLPFLKFGKLDVMRYPQLASQYNIDTSSWSRQLPTIILFRNGQEIDRRPVISAKSKTAHKFTFNENNIIAAFSLNQLYKEYRKLSDKKLAATKSVEEEKKLQ